MSLTPDDIDVATAARARQAQLRSILGSMFLSNLLIGVLNFALQIAFARVLGPIVIGDYATAFVAISLISALTSFGINHGVIAIGFTSRRFRNALVLIIGQTLLTVSAMLVLVCVVYIVYPETVERLWRIALLIGLGVVILPVAHIFNVEMESRLEYRKFSIMRLASFLAANLFAAVILYFGARNYVLPIRDLLNTLTLLILSFFLMRQKVSLRFDKRVIHAIVSATRDIWLTNLLGFGSVRLDFALVGACVNPVTFAIYFQTRNLIAGVLTLWTYPIQSAAFSFVRQHRDKLAVKSIILKVGCLAVGLGLFGVVFLYIIGMDLITLILGEKWRAGSVVLAPFAAYMIATLYFEILVSMAKALNCMRAVLTARFINLGLIVVGVPVAALRMGIEGAGWATAGATVAMAIIGATMLYTNPKAGWG